MCILSTLLDEIRRIEGITLGQEMPDNPHLGERGQMLENLLYFDPYWLDQVTRDGKLQADVAETASYYLSRLRERQAAA